MNKGVVYYTDNHINQELMEAVQYNLRLICRAKRIPIVSVSLSPMKFGDKNFVLSKKRGYLTMFEQILCGLENSTADVIFFCEHDVLYHPSHFDFNLPFSNMYFYNLNVWKADYETGRAVKVDDCKQTSGLYASRELLLQHYHKRVELVKEFGFSRNIGFEPGTHNRKERVDDYKAEGWSSPFPNIDIRHPNNLTMTRWSPNQFRNLVFAEGWTESNVRDLPGWKFI